MSTNGNKATPTNHDAEQHAAPNGIKLPIYMDNHATTPMDPRVLEEMLPYFMEKFGNAASRNHPFGWVAEEAVELSRERIAKLIGATPKEIIFTSGATESDNLAIKGVAEMYREKSNHIITAVTEHKAVLDTCKRLEKYGYRVTYLPVQKDGLIDLDDLKRAMDAHQQRVLMRHQQLAVVRNGRPPHAVHQRIVATHPARAAVFHDVRQLGGGNFLAVILLRAGHQLGLAAHRVLALGEARDGHSQQPGDHAAVEPVARLLGNLALFLHPTGAPPRHVGSVEVFLGERLGRLEQFQHRFGELGAGGPRFIHSAAGQHVGAAGAFADARVTIARQERLAALARFLQRFGAPTAQLRSLQIAPEVRVQHVVLQVAV